MLISEWKGKLPSIPTILKSLTACERDHLPIAMIIMLRPKQCGRAKEVFLLTPNQMNAEAVKAAALQYNAQFQILAANMRACGSQMRFYAHVDEL